MNFEGTGIGPFPLFKRIVQRPWGERIWAEVRGGKKGAAFYFTPGAVERIEGWRAKKPLCHFCSPVCNPRRQTN